MSLKKIHKSLDLKVRTQGNSIVKRTKENRLEGGGVGEIGGGWGGWFLCVQRALDPGRRPLVPACCDISLLILFMT